MTDSRARQPLAKLPGVRAQAGYGVGRLLLFMPGARHDVERKTLRHVGIDRTLAVLDIRRSGDVVYRHTISAIPEAEDSSYDLGVPVDLIDLIGDDQPPERPSVEITERRHIMITDVPMMNNQDARAAVRRLRIVSVHIENPVERAAW